VLNACNSGEEEDDEEDEDDAEFAEVTGRDVSAAAIPPLLNILLKRSMQDGQSDNEWRSYKETIIS
jgi:hypothetical protein